MLLPLRVPGTDDGHFPLSLSKVERCPHAGIMCGISKSDRKFNVCGEPTLEACLTMLALRSCFVVCCVGGAYSKASSGTRKREWSCAGARRPTGRELEENERTYSWRLGLVKELRTFPHQGTQE